MTVLVLILMTAEAFAGNGDLIVDGTLNIGSGGVKFPNNSIQQTAWSPGTYVKISDVKPSGTCSQTAIAGTWNTRHLNSMDNNFSGLATLISNQITFTPGTYLVHIYSPHYGAGLGAARLRNLSNETTIIDGTNVYGQPSIGVATYSIISGSFTVAADQVLEVQHYFSGGPACAGGPALGISGRNEVYTVAEFWKVQ